MEKFQPKQLCLDKVAQLWWGSSCFGGGVQDVIIQLQSKKKMYVFVLNIEKIRMFF